MNDSEGKERIRMVIDKEDNPKLEFLDDIPKRKSWMGIISILKGWSDVKKFYIRDENGREFLLRLVDMDLYEKKKLEFENIEILSQFDINISKAIDFGICNKDNSLYSLFTQIDGEDAIDVLKLLDEKKQYKLGWEAGRIQIRFTQ